MKVIACCANTLLRRGLVQTLQESKAIEVVADSDDGEKVLPLIGQLKPDAVLLGSAQKGLPTADLIHRIKKINPSIVVLACFVKIDIKEIIPVLEAGADACLLENTKPEALVPTITTAIAGESILDPKIMEALLESGRWYPQIAKNFEENPLGKKEFHVLKLGAKGIKSKNIASELNMSLSTVKAHWSKIFIKLGVNSRGQAVYKAIRENWLAIEDIE